MRARCELLRGDARSHTSARKKSHFGAQELTLRRSGYAATGRPLPTRVRPPRAAPRTVHSAVASVQRSETSYAATSPGRGRTIRPSTDTTAVDATTEPGSPARGPPERRRRSRGREDQCRADRGPARARTPAPPASRSRRPPARRRPSSAASAATATSNRIAVRRQRGVGTARVSVAAGSSRATATDPPSRPATSQSSCEPGPPGQTVRSSAASAGGRSQAAGHRAPRHRAELRAERRVTGRPSCSSPPVR